MEHTKTNIQLIKEIAWVLSLASAQNKLDVPGEYTWAFPQSQNVFDVKARSMSIFSSGNSVKDVDVIKFIQGLNLTPYLKNPWTVYEFEDKFKSWIAAGKYFTLQNLNDFQYTGFSAGSQEAFTNFYLVNRNKRFRVFRGEYWWHINVWSTLGINWKYIEDDDIRANDVCICSTPFALTGDVHPQLSWLINECNRVGVELLLDFIYLPNSKNAVNINLANNCIQTITFSLSKTFPVQTAKIAIRMCKNKPHDMMQISNDENICNRLSAGLGLEVINKFPVDYVVDKYASKQQEWCKLLGLTPAKVVHFGLGENYHTNSWFSEYNVQSNRYNLGMLYENSHLLQGYLKT